MGEVIPFQRGGRDMPAHATAGGSDRASRRPGPLAMFGLIVLAMIALPLIVQAVERQEAETT